MSGGKLKKLYFPICLAILFLGACQPSLPPDGNELPPLPKDTEGKEWFYAVNFITKNFYQLDTTLRYEGKKCLIYVENGDHVILDAEVEAFAREYDDKIYDIVVNNFCKIDFSVNGTAYKNTLEYASSLTGRDDKMIILFLDIKDEFAPPGNTGYIAGYFDPTNFFVNLKGSNNKNMIYIDIYPGLNNKAEMYSTLIHELQHLANFANSLLLRENRWMDTWINEGLSLISEYLYRGEPIKSRIDWFNKDQQGTIAMGNNFYLWDNYDPKTYPNAILDEYATAYMFFHWLYLQAGNDNNVLRGISTSGSSDFHAVTERASSFVPGGNDWEVLLRTWLAANYINNSTDQYGYKGEKAFANLTIRGLRNANNKIQLYPGEGVYSRISGSSYTPGSSGANIRYAGLAKGSEPDVSAPSYTGTVLLTFNKKAEDEKTFEEGFLAGGAAGVLTSIAAANSSINRSAAESDPPVRIDAQDLLRRNNNFPFPTKP